MTFKHVLVALAVPAVLVACAQQEERPVIQGDLLFDKFGGAVGCDEGVYIPGAPQIYQCRPPGDVCDEYPNAAAYDPLCLPPSRQPRDPGDDDNNGQVPGTTPTPNPNNPTRGLP